MSRQTDELTMSSGPPPAYLGAVRCLVDEVDGIATRVALGASAAALRRHAGDLDSAARPVVVVVGETKRGKSRLINELLGVTGLSPVDVNVKTAVWVRFDHGPGAAQILFADETTRSATICEAQHWIGAGESAPSVAQPIGAIVHCPSELLTDVTLVDTPGFGGLAAAHRAITLRALQASTALVYVTDAMAPISQVELQFLAEATEQIGEVLFVITKVDLEPGWEEVLAENQRLVRRTVPGLAGAPWMAVSSARHERARTLAGADAAGRDRAAVLSRDSGIGDVHDWLVTFARVRAQITKARNVVHHAESILHRVDDMLAGQLESLTDDSAYERVRQRLLANRSAVELQLATWLEKIPRELLRVKSRAANEVSEEVARICVATIGRVDALEAGWRDAAFELGDALVTAASAVLQRFSDDAHDVIGSIVGERTVSDPSFHVAIADTLTVTPNATRLAAAGTGRHSQDSFDTTDAIELFGNTRSVAEATRLVGTFLSPAIVSRQVLRRSADLLFPGLGVLVGLGLAVAHRHNRERARDQHELRDQVREQSDGIRQAMLRDLDVRYDQMNQALGAGSEAWARQRIAEIEASLDRAARARQAQQDRIDTESASLELDRSAVASTLSEAADVLRAL